MDMKAIHKALRAARGYVIGEKMFKVWPSASEDLAALDAALLATASDLATASETTSYFSFTPQDWHSLNTSVQLRLRTYVFYARLGTGR